MVFYTFLRSLVYPILLFSSFFFFFVLITEEGVLISPCCSLELCIQMGISFLFSFAFSFFSQLLVQPPPTTILPFFFLGMVLITVFSTNIMNSTHSSSGTLSIRSNQFSSVQLLSPVRLFATPWTAACPASLSITNSWNLLKLIP